MNGLFNSELEQVRNTRDELVCAIDDYLTVLGRGSVDYGQHMALVRAARVNLDRALAEARDEQRIEVEEADAGTAEINGNIAREAK